MKRRFDIHILIDDFIQVWSILAFSYVDAIYRLLRIKKLYK